MKYGIYKNEWSTADVDPFTIIDAILKVRINSYAFVDHQESEDPLAVYPMSAFYVVALEDCDRDS